MTKLSRDAELIAMAFFGMGQVCKVTFGRRHGPMTARAAAAFKELVDAKQIVVMSKRDLARDVYGWKAVVGIGRPMIDYKRPKDAESFPLFKSE